MRTVSFAMTLKKYEKFEKELTYRFKVDMRNVTNFDLSTRKSQKFAIQWPVFDQSMECLS